MLKALIILLLSAIISISLLGCKFGEKQETRAAIKEFEGIITCHEII
jgi:hypothetical protein